MKRFVVEREMAMGVRVAAKLSFSLDLKRFVVEEKKAVGMRVEEAREEAKVEEERVEEEREEERVAVKLSLSLNWKRFVVEVEVGMARVMEVDPRKKMSMKRETQEMSGDTPSFEYRHNKKTGETITSPSTMPCIV